MSDTLPDVAIQKASNLVRDARLAVVVALIPLLGLIFILRLVQWYLLRRQFPALATNKSDSAKQFRSALHSLWFAVLLWPAIFVFIGVYMVVM